MGGLAAAPADTFVGWSSAANASSPSEDADLSECRHHWLHTTTANYGQHKSCLHPDPVEAEEVASTPTTTNICDFGCDDFADAIDDATTAAAAAATSDATFDADCGSGAADASGGDGAQRSAYVRSELQRILRQQG